MNFASAMPCDDLDSCLLRDIFREELIRQHDGFIDAPFAADMFDDGNSVRAGAADVALGFHVSRGVHIGHNRNAGVALLDELYVLTRNRTGQRTPRPHRGDKHTLVRAEDFRRFRHEMHTALDDHFRIGLGGLNRKAEAVTCIIADQTKDIWRHVIMGKNDRVLLFF